MSEKSAQLRDVLERLYRRYNHKEFIPPDPLQFVYEYDEPGDMEIAGLLAAVLAYGRVRQIEKSVTDLLGRMDGEPFKFVVNFGQSQRKQLQGFKHRFTSGDDISDLLVLLKAIVDEQGSIEKFFLLGYKESDPDIIAALSNFCTSLTDMYASEHGGQISSGLKYLLADPARGSACKRLNLFLRWMVRDDEVDAGVWKSIDKAKLVVPIDVHMCRLCRILGFHSGKTASLSVALKITKEFAGIEAADPVKYDFCLSRIGILKNCTGRLREGCTECELYEYCLEIKG